MDILEDIAPDEIEVSKKILDGLKNSITLCQTVIETEVDRYVLMTPDGNVLHGTKFATNVCIKPVGKSTEHIFRRTKSNAGFDECLKLVQHLKDRNPDNPVVQTLKVGHLKDAAKKSMNAHAQVVHFLDMAFAKKNINV